MGAVDSLVEVPARGGRTIVAGEGGIDCGHIMGKTLRLIEQAAGFLQRGLQACQ